MKRKLYQEIEIDNYDDIVKKTLQYAREKTTLFETKFGKGWMLLPFDDFLSYVPEIKTAFDRYGLKPRECAFYLTEYYISQYKINPIHIDYYPQDARINIPILNVSGTRTEFYTNVQYILAQNIVPYYRITNTDYEIVDSLETKTSTVFNIKQAHRVVVPDGNDLPRIMLVIATDIDPAFLLD
jgi:hypothetical protein